MATKKQSKKIGIKVFSRNKNKVKPIESISGPKDWFEEIEINSRKYKKWHRIIGTTDLELIE